MGGLAKIGAKISLARFINAAVSFIGLSYFAQILGPDRLGLFFLFQAVLGMAALGANFGFGGSLLKRLSEGKDREKFLGTGITLICFSTSIVLIIVYIIQGYINQYIGTDLAILLILAIASREAYKLSINVLRGELRVGETALLETGQKWIWVGLGVIFIHLGLGPIGLIYSLIAGFIAPAIYGVYLWDVSPAPPSFKHAISLFEFAKYGVVAFIDSFLYKWADVLILGFLLSTTAVGAYEAAWRVTMLVVIVSSAIETTILPQISEWSSNDQYESIENELPKAILGGVFLVIPSFFGVVLLGREILRYVFGEGFTIATAALIILMGGKVIEAIDGILKNILAGMDRPDLRAYAVLFSMTVNILLNFLFISQFGLIGAAFATTISFATSTFIMIIFLKKFIKLEFPLREIAWLTISATVMSLTIYVFQYVIGIKSVLSLALVIFIGAVVYLLLTIIHPNIRSMAISLIPDRITTFILGRPE